MNLELISALDELEKEKGINKESLLETIKASIIKAYKGKYGESQNARVAINEETGEINIFAVKTVVDDVFDDTFEISLEDARKINIAYELGDTLEIEITADSFGRIAAQKAKQNVVQFIRGAEQDVIYDEFANKTGEIMNATIQRIDRNAIYLDLGRVEGLLPLNEKISGEKYEQGMRIKVYILEVRKTQKGPQIVTSRSHPGLVKRLFELEVPEIKDNSVVIKNIAREAGQRTKISVFAENDNIDPVGACVGPRGSRIDSIVSELGNERIDVIPWSSDITEYISNALRPASVIMCQIHNEEKAAKVVVPDNQLSLAIGKEGQNARLAAKLTGFKIDIKSKSQIESQIDDSGFDYEDSFDNGYEDNYNYEDNNQ